MLLANEVTSTQLPECSVKAQGFLKSPCYLSLVIPCKNNTESSMIEHTQLFDQHTTSLALVCPSGRATTRLQQFSDFMTESWRDKLLSTIDLTKFCAIYRQSLIKRTPDGLRWNIRKEQSKKYCRRPL